MICFNGGRLNGRSSLARRLSVVADAFKRCREQNAKAPTWKELDGMCEKAAVKDAIRNEHD